LIIRIENINIVNFVNIIAIVTCKESFVIRINDAWDTVDNVGVNPFRLKVSEKMGSSG
jgi:hypothetical protein